MENSRYRLNGAALNGSDNTMTTKNTLRRMAKTETEPDAIRPGQFWSVKSGRDLLSFVVTHAVCADGSADGPAFRLVPVTIRLDKLAPGDIRIPPAENDLDIPMAVECWAELPMLTETLLSLEHRFHGTVHASAMRQVTAYLDRGGSAIDAGNVDSTRMGPPIALIDPEIHQRRLDEFLRFSSLAAPAVARISGIGERKARTAIVGQYLSLDPSAPRAKEAKDDYYFRLAARKFDAYDSDYALFLLDRVLKSHPTYLPAIWMDIRCRQELGMPSVIGQYKLFAEKFPRQKIWKVAWGMATLQGTLNPDRKMEEMVRECIEDRLTAVFARLLLVKILRRSGRLDEARREARLLGNLRSKDPYVYRIAAIEMWRVDEKLALRFLEKSIALQPADPVGYAKVGEVNRKLGRFDEAVRWLQRAYLLDPRDVGNLNEMSFLERERNDFTRAKEWLKRALEIDPDNASTIAQMGYICRDMRAWDESIQWFMKCHQIIPKNQWAVRQIAYVYRGMKKYTKALEWMEKAHRLDPRNVRTLQRLARVLRDVGDNGRADKVLMKAYRIDPSNSFTIGWVSDSFRNRGLYEQAVKWADIGCKVNPSDVHNIRRIVRLCI